MWSICEVEYAEGEIICKIPCFHVPNDKPMQTYVRHCVVGGLVECPSSEDNRNVETNAKRGSILTDSKVGHPSQDKWIPLEYAKDTGVRTGRVHQCPKRSSNGDSNSKSQPQPQQQQKQAIYPVTECVRSSQVRVFDYLGDEEETWPIPTKRNYAKIKAYRQQMKEVQWHRDHLFSPEQKISLEE